MWCYYFVTHGYSRVGPPQQSLEDPSSQARSDHSGIPRDIEAQADYWKKYYRTTGDTDHFIDASNELEEGCSKSVGVDIVFVLDSSGSIGWVNFETMKQFVKDVVEGFDIGHVSLRSQ